MKMISERVAWNTANYKIMVHHPEGALGSYDGVGRTWPFSNDLFRSSEDAEREIEDLKAMIGEPVTDHEHTLFVEATDEGLAIGHCDVCGGSGWIVQPDENEEKTAEEILALTWKQVDCPSDCRIGNDGDREALYRVKPTSPVTHIEGE